MASRLLWASRAASYLRISVSHRGFASACKYAGDDEDGKWHGVVKDLKYAESHEWVKVDVESVKATSDVYSPVSGNVVEVNEELNNSPGLVNSSPYEKGWIMKVEVKDASELDTLKNSDDYAKFCDEEDAKH
ncbi:GLYCINE CLEAVAGE SYSTEM H PROTEIN [Salix viminalis]|uniref:GLYCINE CLEAVAGE SYSTEM H PROTEIN n=1 Tax=Salix viminalis TaxID=40686 RepID=A0A9Q0NUP6_SALVM|nr:GLYCINE CLEAVAGE SYSTEM H PROTEIN [Salix viminalis]